MSRRFVGNSVDSARLIADGLVPAGHVDDCQATHGKPGGAAQIHPLVIRATVAQRATHRQQAVSIRLLATPVNHPCNTAHVSLSYRYKSAKMGTGTIRMP